MSVRAKFCLSAIALAVAAAANAAPIVIHHPDHYEFDASLSAPFHPDAQGSYRLTLQFDYPGAGDDTLAAWQVDVLDTHGKSVRRWIGEDGLQAQHNRYVLAWDGRDGNGQALDPGYYTVRLEAVPSLRDASSSAKTKLFDRVHRAFALFGGEKVAQSYDVMLGHLPAPRMQAFRALPIGVKGEAALRAGQGRKAVPATGSLPYTVYYGNLHSQTNHSDGAGPIASCTGEQNPQSAALGPADAYAMMQNQAHGDFLMASEHNHMYDGSTSTNTSANPATAKALFASGLTAAANYSTAHPGFLALYGNEWGVISNGGHMNVFGLDGLLEWEKNSSGQLIGDYYTPKGDYAAMYALMKQHGWIGMFNHPAATGQFNIGGTDLAYDANGNDVMVLAEVLNSYAFSTNTSETETSRPNYLTAFNTLLERGYHVAPASDQDNHCANWGLSYRNRTAVLLPTGTTLNQANFFDALRARRVFAAEDRNGQLILTANGQLMGQTITNSGALTLVANYASADGQTAARVQFFQGVPGSNGTVAQLYEGSGTTTTTPGIGAHFYYVEVTQANGDRLWSAPIWVNEVAGGGDTTPPSASASESGSSGAITLSASASDNVGVTNVEFYVDGALKGSDASSPYSMPLDSTTLADGSHSLVAKAHDAAGNIGTSSSAGFTISNSASGQFTEIEPNASIAGANVVSAGYGSITGTLKSTVDKDYFRIALTPHQTISIDMAGPAGKQNYDLYLFKRDGTPLASSTGATSTESLAYKNGAAAQNVFAEVASASGSSKTAAYTLTLTYTGGSGGGGGPVERVGNGGFESGAAAWTASSGVINSDGSQAAHAGSWKAKLDGYGAVHIDTLLQAVTIPASATSASLNFWLQVESAETTTTKVYDTLAVQVRDSGGNVLATLGTYTNLDKGSSYVQRSFDLGAYKGQTVQLYFAGTEDKEEATSFLVDDVSLMTQ